MIMDYIVGGIIGYFLGIKHEMIIKVVENVKKQFNSLNKQNKKVFKQQNIKIGKGFI